MSSAIIRPLSQAYLYCPTEADCNYLGYMIQRPTGYRPNQKTKAFSVCTPGKDLWME